MKRIINAIRRERTLCFNDKESLDILLPNLEKNKQNSYSSEKLYLYWWVAENIQYYHLPLIPYKVSLLTKKRYLGDTPSFAVFPLKYTFNTYFSNVIKSPERALIRKAIKNGIMCRPINYDEHLCDILEINMSKAIRGGRPMTNDYRNLHYRDAIVKAYNSDVFSFGAFTKEGKLVAYYMFEKVTNFLHVVKGIGHKDYLNLGIMNYLFAFSIAELSSYQISSWIIYGRMSQGECDGLSRYKKNVGCEAKYVRVMGTKKQFKALSYFCDNYELHGDTSMNYILDYLYLPEERKVLYSK